MINISKVSTYLSGQWRQRFIRLICEMGFSSLRRVVLIHKDKKTANGEKPVNFHRLWGKGWFVVGLDM